MNMKSAFTRRTFLQRTALAAAGAATVSAMRNPAQGAVTKPETERDKGLKLGIASYSLRKFPLQQAIAMTRQAGLNYITLKDVHLSFKSSPAELAAARKQIEAAGLTLMGGGVIYINNKEAEARTFFEYAKQAGMPTIVCSPDPEALGLVEKLAEEYDTRIAIHNHGPGDKRYPSPLDVLRLVQDRSLRMGICIDVGHTVRLGEDPVEVIQKCATRLYDFHIKDVSTATAKGAPVQVGRGVIDIVAVLKTLARLQFKYHVALEYEADADAPLAGIAESVGYMRGVLATF
jgi:inosose dehydratase